MSGIRLEGNTSGNVAEVNSSNELKVTLTQSEATAGYVTVTAESDSGAITGSRLMRDLEVSTDYRLRIGQDALMFSEYFPGAAINSAIWTAPVTTMTVTVASGFANLNAGLSTANAAVARVSSYRSFPLYNTVTTYMECICSFSQAPQANNIVEWGFGIASGTTAPTDGVFFRFNAAGEFRCVTNTNGSELQSNSLNFNTLIIINQSHHFIVGITDDTAEFWIDDVLVATVARPSSGYTIAASQNLPVFFRNYNTNITSLAQVLRVALVGVTLADLGSVKPWVHTRAGAGDMGYQGPTAGTMGSTALYTNSLAAGAGAAATNTTAALGSGLGGQFSLLPTLAVPGDGVISSYQVPAGTAAVPGKSLYITGVHIMGIVSTVLVGGPVLGLWSLAFGHNAVTLATTESATAKAPRRIPLGIQTWVAAAALGVQADRDIHITLQTPVVVHPGEFVQTVFKNIGTVTTTGVITFLIAFDSYWE